MRDSVDVRCIAHICTRMIYVGCWILFCQWSRRAGAWRLLSACLGIRASSIRISEDPRTRCLFGPRMVFRREGLNSTIMGCPPAVAWTRRAGVWGGGRCRCRCRAPRCPASRRPSAPSEEPDTASGLGGETQLEWAHRIGKFQMTLR